MAAPLTICGLGPGSAELVTAQTRRAISEAEHCLLRTRHHPSAGELCPNARSLDHHYLEHGSFAEVYNAVVEEVVATAQRGPTTYVVPGSPLVLERSVELLMADPRLDVTLLASMSFLDLVWARLGIDPIDSGVKLIDGLQFADQVGAAGGGPLLIAHTHADWVLSDVKLAVEAGPETRAVILQALGTDQERVVEVGWPDLDRTISADHLTSVFVPSLGSTLGSEAVAAVDLMHKLRQECPWDQAQTHRSLRPYLIEEAYEVLEVLDLLTDETPATDPGFGDLEEELGDLLFQVLFHAELAQEAGAFTFSDVIRTLRAKLTDRHPHVFGEVEAPDAAAVAANWERIKQAEKGRLSVLDGIPPGLPALSLAAKTLRRLERAGASVQGVAAPPTGQQPDIGSALFGIVAAAYQAGEDPELALREHVARLSRRFREAEDAGSAFDVAD